MTTRALFVGLTTLDIVHRVASHVGPDEKVSALGQDIAAGGPAANAASTFAALGGHAQLLTALGAHPLSAAARADLAERGVDVVDATPDRRDPLPVSAVRVLDATGERSVTSRNDSGRDAPAPHEYPLAGVDVVVLDGWHRDLALGAAEAARRVGVPIVLGAGSWRPLVEELLSSADVVVASSTFPVERIDAAIAWAQTHGAQPVRWHTAEGGGAIAVPAVAARDTLGAGDVFLGAAALALARKDTVEGAMRYAASVASQRVGHLGMRAALAALAETAEIRRAPR